MKSWSLICGTKPDKDIIMIWCKKPLDFFGKHPNFAINLASLALNGDGMRSGLVGDENVYAASVT